MENLNLILYISMAVPLAMMLAICKHRSRMILLFLLLGASVCLFSSEFSGVLCKVLPFSFQFFTINITPFTEEVLKAVPVLMYAFLYKPTDEYVLECSIADGVGFALLENAFILSQNVASISIPLALIRGFGAGMMHGLCTFAVGYGMTFIHKRRKLFYCGTSALLGLAVMFHSLYNILVQSEHMVIGYVLPIVAFVPLLAVLKKKNRI